MLQATERHSPPGVVRWRAWWVRDGTGGLWAGCRRLDDDPADYSFGPGAEDALRRAVVGYAELLETWRPLRCQRRVVVEWSD